MCGDDAFATCSRDKTVRVWREAIGGVGFACSTVCAGHQSFVTALAYAPATDSVVSGGRDKKLIAWDPATGDAKATMVGDELDVTTVCILSDGRIASGSMDKAIKIYDPAKSYECVETLTGHESSVLALVALPAAQGGGFLSGSADSTIRAWKNAAGDGPRQKSAKLPNIAKLNENALDAIIAERKINKNFIKNASKNHALILKRFLITKHARGKPVVGVDGIKPQALLEVAKVSGIVQNGATKLTSAEQEIVRHMIRGKTRENAIRHRDAQKKKPGRKPKMNSAN